MAPQTATRMTYEEFMALPDDGKHYELIEGELVLNPAPNLRHQAIIGNLYLAFRLYLDQHRSGKVFVAAVDVVLSIENVLEPDVIVILADRAARLQTKNVQGAPNIAVEVLSPGSRRKDEVTKKRLYEHFGVDEYWIADPETETVKIYRRAGDAFERAIEFSTGSITSALLPGFTLDVAAVFAE
ncbi:MAG TPA: Uma2 family endonuclease [Thermoanaerobaculia bacterium]|nr:Uma2 family endonuclease [Thermoanaerobaculia bacterium]